MDPDKASILLLLDQYQNRHLLQRRLGQRYTVRLGLSAEALAEPFDVGVVDGQALSRLRDAIHDRRVAEQPLALPFLLITSRRDVSATTSHLWELVDELLLTPIEGIELLARIEMLLRVRRQSLALQARGMEQLRASEERYRLVSQLVSDYAYAFSVSPDGKATLEWITQAFERISGYTVQELDQRGLPWEDVVHPDDRPIVERRLRRLRAGETDISEYRIVSRDGQTRWLRDYSRPVIDGLSTGMMRIYGAAQDITERRALEEQLRQAQKIEALGRLAGGVAHDFNNLLTVINGYSDMMSDSLNLDDPLYQDIREIRAAGERASNLTRQLLAFSRRQVFEMKVLDLNALLSGMGKMLGRLIGEDIRLEMRLGPGLSCVRGDAGQIEQVIVNLAVNARDAMPEGGALTIETANTMLDASFATTHLDVHSGPYVVVSVADTGCGMSDEVKQHIFEPFFTTKEKGRGTGLGLATVYGIVRQMGGSINVYSELGRGTIVKIYWPAAREDESAIASDIEAVLPRGDEAILVVEDDPAVRAVAVQVLESLGYQVIESSGGAHALTLCMARPRPVDLVLTDIVMPEMSGTELVKRLRALYPNVKVIFMSGYTDDALNRLNEAVNEVDLVQKPFSKARLAHLVRAKLDAV